MQEKNAGNSESILYYRYRIAPALVDLDVWHTYQKKVFFCNECKKGNRTKNK